MVRPSDPDFAARLAAGPEHVPPRRAALRRLADSTRGVIDALVSTDASEEALQRIADRIDEVVAELAGQPHGRSYEGFAESALAGGGLEADDPRSYFDHSPVIGAANPLAPPVDIRVVDGVVHATAHFGAAYEGPPGGVHGGWIAASFDEVLGMVQSLSGAPGMTGTLGIRYRRPTPLHTDLRFEATLDRQEGRKLFTSGRLYVGDDLTAEAEGLFISVDFEKIAGMMAARHEQGERRA